jgi:hypothetical protein
VTGPRSARAVPSGSADYPLHRHTYRAAFLEFALHAPGIDPVEELVGVRGDLLGNVISAAQDVDVQALFAYASCCERMNA